MTNPATLAARMRAQSRVQQSSDIDLAAWLEANAVGLDDMAYTQAYMREAALRLRQYAARRAAAAG